MTFNYPPEILSCTRPSSLPRISNCFVIRSFKASIRCWRMKSNMINTGKQGIPMRASQQISSIIPNQKHNQQTCRRRTKSLFLYATVGINWKIWHNRSESSIASLSVNPLHGLFTRLSCSRVACPIVPKVDYYSSMFFCDFLVIVLIIAGHQRFSRSESVEDNIVYRYLQGSSSIELTPIVMLLSEFLLIIVDRMIYLKKHVQAKFLFLCLQFLVLHVWLVIIYPIWFHRAMSKNWAAVSIYIFKSIYFMLSALQIRNG